MMFSREPQTRQQIDETSSALPHQSPVQQTISALLLKLRPPSMLTPTKTFTLHSVGNSIIKSTSVASTCCLLLLFILHLTSSTHQQRQVASGPTSTSIVSTNRMKLDYSTHSQTKTTTTTTTRRRVKRSSRHFEATKRTSAGLAKAANVLLVEPERKKSSAAGASAGKPSNLEALSFRDGAGQVNNYSANNRGFMSTGGQPAAAQWIPIVKPASQQARPAPPTVAQRAPQRPPTQTTATTTTRTTSNVNNPQPRTRHQQRQQGNNRHHLQTLESSLGHFRHYEHPSRHYNHHAHHHHHHHHQHRRPRYNYEATGGMYRRVLLCDKTLVSLDYVRNLNMEPRRPPFPPGLPVAGDFELNELADNFIDLDGHYDNSRDDPQLVRRNSTQVDAATGSSLNVTTTTTATTTATATNVNVPVEKLNVSESNHLAIERADAFYGQQLTGFGHGYGQLLSDDDPLVRCDMWDLEKGLKNRAPPEHLVRRAIKADFDTVREAINRCRQLSERTHRPPAASAAPDDDYYRDHSLELMSTEDLMSLFSMKRGLMPGTKWCGLGDQANSYNDLGPKYRIDICCRAHDHCPIRSKPFRNDYGVLNIGLYTKSHCDCDADFYRCLREVRSRTADLLGNLYFNVMKLQCMREERMKVCREMKPIALLGIERCTKYEDSPIKTVFKFTTPPVAY